MLPARSGPQNGQMNNFFILLQFSSNYYHYHLIFVLYFTVYQTLSQILPYLLSTTAAIKSVRRQCKLSFWNISTKRKIQSKQIQTGSIWDLAPRQLSGLGSNKRIKIKKDRFRLLRNVVFLMYTLEFEQKNVQITNFPYFYKHILQATFFLKIEICIKIFYY